jgi:antibiotic biosynthesis monooxygenase (ABM) superfamily enzyme
MDLKKLFPIAYKKSLLIAIIIYLVVAIIAGLFLEEPAAMFVALGLLITDTIICVIYSYKIAKKY